MNNILIKPNEILGILCLILALLLSFLQSNLENGDLEVIVPIGIVTVLMLLTLFMIWGQPTSNVNLSFKVIQKNMLSTSKNPNKI